MLTELTEEHIQYLRERGFKVVNGRPTDADSFPYITLEDLTRHNSQFAATYHFDDSGAIGSTGKVHPSAMGTHELVDRIALMIASCKVIDGKRFTTQPGTPIKLFVMDPAWTYVAEALAAKYS